ncbi:hypothetical protein [Pedococcus sp.]|uniref:hypothetical protein n=1 Tax=Pedococcus sp. TaxID=2860345 RepID=UPI002E167448|nr:hypothetical protein [Pedococcus sp.]
MLRGTARRVTLSVVAVFGALALSAAAPAFAANLAFVGTNQPTVVSAAQGSTTTLDWTIKNTGAPGLYGSTVGPLTNGTVTFNAPTGTIFPAQATVPTSYSSNGTTFGANAARLDGCMVGSGGTTLTCTWEATTSTGGPYGWPSGGYFRFAPTVLVSPTATPGTYSAATDATTPYNTAPGTVEGQQDITYGTLDITITPVVAVPVIDLRVAFALLPIGAIALLGVRRAGRRAGRRAQLS